jgi:hypothetical protein
LKAQIESTIPQTAMTIQANSGRASAPIMLHAKCAHVAERHRRAGGCFERGRIDVHMRKREV